MSNEHNLRNASINELLSELSLRRAIVSIRGVGVYPLVTATCQIPTDDNECNFAVITFPADASPSSKLRERPLSRAFDADQYFLDLVSRGVSATRARRLANLAADVDALAGSLAKEDDK